MAHTPRHHYTREEQIEAWKLDLIADIEHSEHQAEHGPFYPERGITPESLRAYAENCRRMLEEPEDSLRAALESSHLPF